MAIKPSPTIAGKLRKLFSNNKQTIEPAINESVPGGSGGGNVLTLYINEFDDNYANAYKNSECTESYESYTEAYDAVRNADIIEVVQNVSSPTGTYKVYTALNKVAQYVDSGQSVVQVSVASSMGIYSVNLWQIGGKT